MHSQEKETVDKRIRENFAKNLQHDTFITNQSRGRVVSIVDIGINSLVLQ